MQESPSIPESTVVVVRHGETDWNREGRFQGWGAVGLNDRGRRQARALGRHLAETYELDRVLASDLRRARETAALLREAGVAPEPAFEATWRERGLGIYQGLTYDDLYGEHPEFDPSNGLIGLESRPEGGESLLDLYRRVRDGWTELCDGAEGETVLLVTHGGPLHVIHGVVNGEDLPTAFVNHSHTNCALSEFRVGAEGRAIEVACKNDTTWAPLVEEPET